MTDEVYRDEEPVLPTIGQPLYDGTNWETHRFDNNLVVLVAGVASKPSVEVTVLNSAGDFVEEPRQISKDDLPALLAEVEGRETTGD